MYSFNDFEIGRNTVIYLNTVIRNGVTVGRNCELGPNICIKNVSMIPDGSKIEENC